jgi:hypothetical protein
MSWNPGTIQTLLDTWQYNTGRVGMEALRGILAAVAQNQPSADQGNPAISSSAAIGTPAATLRSSSGRLYLIRVVNTSANAVNVVLSDGGTTIIVGGCTVPAQIAAAGSIAAIPGVTELAFHGSPQGAGQAILTDLRVRAFLSSDGTTTAAAGVTVTALTSA